MPQIGDADAELLCWSSRRTAEAAEEGTHRGKCREDEMRHSRAKRRGKILYIAVSVILSAVLSACMQQKENGQTAEAVKEYRNLPKDGSFTILTIGAADSGGSMYAASAVIAAAMTDRDDGLRFNISASTGSFENVEEMRRGELDLALVVGDTAREAMLGLGAFKNAPAGQLRAIAALYPSLSNWMVLEESGVSHVGDLVRATAAIGPEYSATDQSARRVFEALGISMEHGNFINAGLGSGADRVASGELDAVHGFAGVPIPGLARLADIRRCRLLCYSEEELEMILREEPAYFEAVIPAGTYRGQESDIRTFGAKCILCVNQEMDEALVYHLTELLYDSLPELAEENAMFAYTEDRRFLFEELPLALHPGAERYYREQGLMK